MTLVSAMHMTKQGNETRARVTRKGPGGSHCFLKVRAVSIAYLWPEMHVTELLYKCCSVTDKGWQQDLPERDAKLPDRRGRGQQPDENLRQLLETI